MKIWALKQNKINFKGEYWLTTDIHDKLPMYCGTLREIETAIKNSKEKSTLLDNGDTFGKIFKLTATKKILDNFVKINPDTNIEKITKAYKSIYVLKKVLSAFLIIYTGIKVVTFFINK